MKFFLDRKVLTSYNLIGTDVRYATELRKGRGIMTQNEQELINIIRTSEDPQQAMMTAIDIICQYLMQHGSLQEQPAADLQVSP